RLTPGHQVVPLRHQELQAFDLLAVLVHREGVDGSDRVDRRAQPLVLLAQPLEVAGDLGRVGEQLIEGLPPFGLDPRDEPAPAAQDLGALELEFVLLRATGVQRLARVLERRFCLGDAHVRRLDLDAGLSGGALQGHKREAALLELVLPLGPLRREGRRVLLQRAHLFGERRGLTARFLDLRRGAPGPFACGAEPRLDLRRIHLPPDSLLPRCLLLARTRPRPRRARRACAPASSPHRPGAPPPLAPPARALPARRGARAAPRPPPWVPPGTPHRWPVAARAPLSPRPRGLRGRREARVPTRPRGRPRAGRP